MPVPGAKVPPVPNVLHVIVPVLLIVNCALPGVPENVMPPEKVADPVLTRKIDVRALAPILMVVAPESVPASTATNEPPDAVAAGITMPPDRVREEPLLLKVSPFTVALLFVIIVTLVAATAVPFGMVIMWPELICTVSAAIGPPVRQDVQVAVVVHGPPPADEHAASDAICHCRASVKSPIVAGPMR